MSGNIEFAKHYYHIQISAQKSEWNQVMSEKIKSFEQRKVWKLAPLSEDRKIMIGTKWIYNIKKDTSGSIKKFKSRLVTLGILQ